MWTRPRIFTQVSASLFGLWSVSWQVNPSDTLCVPFVYIYFKKYSFFWPCMWRGMWDLSSPTRIKPMLLGFPGGAMVKNPPANAGDTGSSPGSGRSHMPRSNETRAPQLLSLRSGARKPQLLSPRATTTEARAPRTCAPQQEKPPQ